MAGAVGGIEQDFLALFAKNLEIARETCRLFNVGEARELVARMIVELARIDEKARLGALQDQRVAKRQGSMRDIMAADVEDPGNRVRIADQQRILGPERGGGAGEFPFCGLSGKSKPVQGDFAKRRRRAIRPDRVDWVWLHGNEFAARGLRCLTEALHLARRVQPRIVAEPRPRAKIGLEPILRSRLGPCLRVEDRKIDLILDRQAIAAIDKNRGAPFEHNGKPRRTGETGKPGEALFARGDIFVLVFVRARNQEAIQPEARELAPQCRDPDRALRGVRPILKGLIETFEHPAKVRPVRLRRNIRRFWCGNLASELRALS